MLLESVSLAFIALAGGMSLLAKANKDNLRSFFRFVAYFIIIGSFLTLLCTIFHGTMRFYGKPYFYKKMIQHTLMEDSMGFHNKEKHSYYGNCRDGCCAIDSYRSGFDCDCETNDSCYMENNKRVRKQH